MTDNENGAIASAPYEASVTVHVNDRAARPIHIQEGVSRSGAILSTARTPNGAPVATIAADTVVTVGRVPMRVGMAVEEGYLVQNQDGSYREVSPEAHEAGVRQRHEAARAEAAKHAARLAPQDEMLFDDLAEGLQAAGYDPIAVISEMAGARKVPDVLYEFGRERGMDAGEMKARINGLSAALGQVIREKLLEPAGIGTEEWQEWLGGADRKGHVDRAFIRAAITGDLSGYRFLVEQHQLQRR